MVRVDGDEPYADGLWYPASALSALSRLRPRQLEDQTPASSHASSERAS